MVGATRRRIALGVAIVAVLLLVGLYRLTRTAEWAATHGSDKEKQDICRIVPDLPPRRRLRILRRLLDDPSEGVRSAAITAAGMAEETQQLLYTPETSGGLLAAVAPEQLDQLKAGFKTANEPLWVVGQVLPGSGVEVAL